MSSQPLSIEDLDDASNDLVDELLREARAQQLAQPPTPFDEAEPSDGAASASTSAIGDDSAESEAGTGKLKIDAFELCAHLADGAYSSVEIGRRKLSRRLYAVKCIDKGRLVRFDKTAAILREKQILGELRHPSCIRLRWTMQDDHQLYMVFDLCVHGDLADFCGEHRPLQSAERARTVFAELVDAVTFLHARDIVHRDIKPENVLFDARWHAVLGDFGCAKRLERSADSGHRVRALSFVGSVGFVPPELLGHADGSETSGVGLRADIFALGATAQVMCTGTPPFLHSDSSEFEVLSRVRHGKRRKPRAKLTDPDLIEVLDAMLQHHAASRPPARRLALFRYFRGCQWPPDRGEKLEPLVPGDTIDTAPATPTRHLSLTDSRGAYEHQHQLQLAALGPDDTSSYVCDDAQLERQKASVWAPFLRLRESETVLVTAPLLRRRHDALHYFHLILTSNQRMLLVRPEPRVLKLSVYVDQVPMFEMTPPPADVPGAVATLTLRLVNDDDEKQYVVFAVDPMVVTNTFDALSSDRSRRGPSLRSSSALYNTLRRAVSAAASTSAASAAADAATSLTSSSEQLQRAPDSSGGASIGRIQLHIASDATTLLDKFRAEFDLTARDLCTKPHVLIAGCTGSGKSTLINNVFGRQVARVGGGVPVTQHFDRYELESESVVIYDSKGLEVGEHTNFMSTTREFLANPDVEVHVVWYIINSAVSRIQPFEVEVCSQLFGKLPVIFIMNKADLSTADERESLRRSILAVQVANCVGLLETSCAPARSTSELPAACAKCGSDDIEFKPKRKLVCCTECGHVEQLVIQTGLDVLVSTTMNALPVLARERFVSAQQVSMTAKDSASRKIITDFHDIDFVHAYLDRQQFNAVAKMLVRLSTVWEFREHSREYATALAREHVGQYSLRDRVFLLMGRQDKRREATLARLTAVGVVWHRCVRSLYTSILALMALGNKTGAQSTAAAAAPGPSDVGALVDTAFQELREEAVERITAQLETDPLQALLDREIPTTVGQGAALSAAAAAAARDASLAAAAATAASAAGARPDLRSRSSGEMLPEDLVGHRRERHHRVEHRGIEASRDVSRDVSRDTSRSVSPDRSVSPGLGNGAGDSADERRAATTRRGQHARRHDSPDLSPPQTLRSALRSTSPALRSSTDAVDDDSSSLLRVHPPSHLHHHSHHRTSSHRRDNHDLSSPDEEPSAGGRRSTHRRHEDSVSHERGHSSLTHRRRHGEHDDGEHSSTHSRHTSSSAAHHDEHSTARRRHANEHDDVEHSSSSRPYSAADNHMPRNRNLSSHDLASDGRAASGPHRHRRTASQEEAAAEEASRSHARHTGSRHASQLTAPRPHRHRTTPDVLEFSAGNDESTVGEVVDLRSSSHTIPRADETAAAPRRKTDVSPEYDRVVVEPTTPRRRSHHPRTDEDSESGHERGLHRRSHRDDSNVERVAIVSGNSLKTKSSSGRRADGGTDESESESRSGMRRRTRRHDAAAAAAAAAPAAAVAAAAAPVAEDGSGSSPSRVQTIRRPSLQMQERLQSDLEEEDELSIATPTRRRHGRSAGGGGDAAAAAVRLSNQSLFTASSDVSMSQSLRQSAVDDSP